MIEVEPGDMGASADADRACALRAESATRSQAEPLVRYYVANGVIILPVPIGGAR